MQLNISIRSLDQNEAISIPNGRIADGITIKQILTIREIANPPVDFLVEIAKDYALPVAAALTAEYILQHLKDRKEKRIQINNKIVNINHIEIEQIVIYILEEKEETESHS